MKYLEILSVKLHPATPFIIAMLARVYSCTENSAEQNILSDILARLACQRVDESTQKTRSLVTQFFKALEVQFQQLPSALDHGFEYRFPFDSTLIEYIFYTDNGKAFIRP